MAPKRAKGGPQATSGSGGGGAGSGASHGHHTNHPVADPVAQAIQAVQGSNNKTVVFTALQQLVQTLFGMWAAACRWGSRRVFVCVGVGVLIDPGICVVADQVHPLRGLPPPPSLHQDAQFSINSHNAEPGLHPRVSWSSF